MTRCSRLEGVQNTPCGAFLKHLAPAAGVVPQRPRDLAAGARAAAAACAAPRSRDATDSTMKTIAAAVASLAAAVTPGAGGGPRASTEVAAPIVPLPASMLREIADALLDDPTAVDDPNVRRLASALSEASVTTINVLLKLDSKLVTATNSAAVCAAGEWSTSNTQFARNASHRSTHSAAAIAARRAFA